MTDGTNLGRCVHAAIAGERKLTSADLWRIPRVGSPAASPDGQQLIVPVTSWPEPERSKLTQLWLMNADGSGARVLTDLNVTAGVAAWSPDGKMLAVTLKQNGDKSARSQVHLLSLEGGARTPLPEFPLGVLDLRWLPDGSGLIVASQLIAGHLTMDATRDELARREQDPVKVHATEERLFRFWDQWLTGEEVPHFFHLDLATGSCRDLTPTSTAWLDFMSPAEQFDVAPDGSEFAFAGLIKNAALNELESRIFRVPMSGGDMDCLTPDAPAGCVRPRYSPDGRSIVYGRKEDRYYYADRPRLYRYDRADKSHAAWCDEWDYAPEAWDFAADGLLIFVAQQAARTHLFSLAPDQDVPKQLVAGGSIGSPCVAANGTLFFTLQSMQQPPEVYCYSAAVPQGRRITTFTTAAMSGFALGEVREFECKGAGGASVQSFVILPPGEKTAKSPAPFVQVVHGGPHGIWGDEFHFRWNAQLIASAGYVVAFPNPQGSTSWGNDYARRIQGEWAARPFEDLMAVIDTLLESGLIDSNRMAAMGGSYGGYMMAWYAGHTDRFRCLVNHAGVYDTLSMYASDSTQGRDRSFGGNPWTGLEAIDACNPARYAANMTTPMLVIHGEQDFRVPVTQGLACYGVLQAKGVPARLVHYPDENHWILKPHNSVRWYQEVFSWLERWLRK